MIPGFTPERAVEPLGILVIVVAFVLIAVSLLGIRLSRRRWFVVGLVGLVVLLVAPATVVAYHEIFTNVCYLRV